MSRHYPHLLFVALLFAASGARAGQSAKPHEFVAVHMGMPVRIVMYTTDESAARVAASAAFARIAALDAMMSDYRPDSEVRRLARRPREWVTVSAELFTVVRRAVDIARATDGAFDITIGPVGALWRDARRTGRRPDPAAIDAALALVGWRHIGLDAARPAIRLAVPGMLLDLSGIAKGYILQDALRTLQNRGMSRALIEAGGDIVVGAPPPGREGWHIDTPGSNAALAARAATLANAALATSGATAQFVEIDGIRYSHVVDPRTGLGVTHDFIARVIADDGGTADAVATALSVLGGERAADLTVLRLRGVVASVHREARQPSGGGTTVIRICMPVNLSHPQSRCCHNFPKVTCVDENAF
ncbi:MAG: FAD:protein FMN transferase [Acidobacteria bacterium]|nr:FAD:protein FMN transferase [Acidobacteriota bacterium]MCA1650121.1 FAD:protein FMN transferase [Acidobacteriota bacterium]